VLQRHLKAQNLEGQFPRFGVVAHSMGTAVAHDALWTLATADFLKDKSVLAASTANAKEPGLVATSTLTDEQREHFTKVEPAQRLIRIDRCLCRSMFSCWSPMSFHWSAA